MHLADAHYLRACVPARERKVRAPCSAISRARIRSCELVDGLEFVPAGARSREGTSAARPGAERAMRVVVALSFAGVLVAFFALGGHRYVSLDTIKANRDALLAYTQAHHAQAVVIAFAVFVTATAFSLPGGLLLTMTFGFLFGRWTGTVIVVFAGTIGGTLLFLAARYVLAGVVRRRLGTLGERINAGFTKHGFSYMLFLRLVPFPFFLVNLAPALTSSRFACSCSRPSSAPYPACSSSRTWAKRSGASTRCRISCRGKPSAPLRCWASSRSCPSPRASYRPGTPERRKRVKVKPIRRGVQAGELRRSGYRHSDHEHHPGASEHERLAQ